MSLPQIAEASSKGRACFVLFRYGIDIVQNKSNRTISAQEINCIFEADSFSDYTLQSKAVLSALLSATCADAFLISVDTRNG